MDLIQLLKDVIRIAFKKTFPFWQFLGLYVLPRHYYEPVPDTTTLRKTLWDNPSELIGIDINEQVQINLLEQFEQHFREDYDRFPLGKASVPFGYYVNNRKFSSVDGEILYCMILYFRPKRILEIGSGYSTYLSAQAVQKLHQDYGHKSTLTAVEPYPNRVLRKGFPGLSKLITAPIQEIPLGELEGLDENDILFIDSSHVLKIGGDVRYEYLEILPRLNKGVIIHFHDIFLPAEYPREWVLRQFKFWNEQYLLQAFLTFNDRFEVLWGGSFMHLKHPELLERAFPSYERSQRWPGSFWIRKIK
jgi:hypothetical protein